MTDADKLVDSTLTRDAIIAHKPNVDRLRHNFDETLDAKTLNALCDLALRGLEAADWRKTMTDKCPKCGATMIEKPPTVIYTSNPPQWDSVMWCACGYSENRGRVRGKTEDELLRDLWKKTNKVVGRRYDKN